MNTRRIRLRRWLLLFGVLSAVFLLVAHGLPWAAAQGWGGPVLRNNQLRGIDATPLFYTECERTQAHGK